MWNWIKKLFGAEQRTEKIPDCPPERPQECPLGTLVIGKRFYACYVKPKDDWPWLIYHTEKFEDNIDLTVTKEQAAQLVAHYDSVTEPVAVKLPEVQK